MKYKKLIEHTPDNYLKAILESIEYYNSYSQADISNLLYKGYKWALDKPEKSISKATIILELISKWIQTFEQVALLGIMFSGKIIEEKRLPFEIYMNYHSQQIMRFLKKAKRGLPDYSVLNIYGLKSAKELLKEKAINVGELDYFKRYINKSIESGHSTFKNMAQAYVGKKRRKKEVIDPSPLVKIYFQTKHGFKVIQSTETSKKIWDVEKDDIVIAESVIKAKENSKRHIMKVGIFKKFNLEDVEQLIKQINDWSKVTKEIAKSQIEKIKNPNWFVKEVRLERSKKLISSGTKKPSRNDKCLCGSGLKFKKCCGSEM